MPLNLTWVDLAFSGTKGYPGQVKRHSLPFLEEAVLKYLVVALTFALDCTYPPVLVLLVAVLGVFECVPLGDGPTRRGQHVGPVT